MIIIKIMGGFASHVCKLFFGAKLAEYLQMELMLDISDYYDGYFRPYNLHLLNIPVFQTVCTREIEKKYSHLIMVRNSDDMENMIKFRRKGNYYIFREETDYAVFFERHPEFEVDAATPYIKTLHLKTSSLFIKEFMNKIAQHTSVAVHIRRGDFVTLGQESKIAYFCAAIAWFYERNPKTQFYFFSNDLEWVKTQFGFNGQFHYVHAQDKKIGDIEDFFCISYCNYRILSSYSSYGLLANTFAAVRSADSFALLEEKKDGGYEYKGIEGSLQYLSKKQIKEYDLKYHDICWRKEDRNSKMQEREVDPLQGKVISRKEKFFVVTCERYSKWFRRGMFEIAVRLAGKGYEVSYINLHDCLEKKEIEVEKACNMDGEEYGFDIIRGGIGQIEQLVGKEQDTGLICDCKLPFGHGGYITFMESHKAKLCQKKWAWALLKNNFKGGLRYVLEKEQEGQCTITLLDDYWENMLMKSGNSNEDATAMFEQIYDKTVGEIIKSGGSG